MGAVSEAPGRILAGMTHFLCASLETRLDGGLWWCEERGFAPSVIYSCKKLLRRKRDVPDWGREVHGSGCDPWGAVVPGPAHSLACALACSQVPGPGVHPQLTFISDWAAVTQARGQWT